MPLIKRYWTPMPHGRAVVRNWFLFATRILHATAMLYCGKLLLEQALLASQKLAEVGEEHFDANFFKGKIASGKFYVMNVVPSIFGTEKAMKAADASAIDCPEEAFM